MTPSQTPLTPAADSLLWSGSTDRGKIRPNNEDAFLGLQFDGREVHHLGKLGQAALSNMDFVFAVSDGMGGARAGEYASRMAVEKITTLLPRSFRQAAVGLSTGFADVLNELFDQIHGALTYLGSSYEECSGMETTLSLCWFTPGWMYFGHIGDSRIYYLPKQKDEIKQLSHDDTHVAWLFRNGKINEREARSHPRRNVLQKALGGGNQFVDPQVGAVACQTGDKFLICSDGLTEGLHDRELIEILHAPEASAADRQPAQDLVRAAVMKDGRDNTTAVVIQVV